MHYYSTVTLLQKDILWGLKHTVVVKKADSSSGLKSSCLTALGEDQNPSHTRGRPKKKITIEDQALVKALQNGQEVNRNERQLKELQSLRKGIHHCYSLIYSSSVIFCKCYLNRLYSGCCTV